MNPGRLLRRLASGALSNVAFADMIRLAEDFGFRVARISGSHHILRHPSVPEMVNLQEVRGQAKPYQIRQFLKLVERHRLVLEDEK
ncbi:MAG: type II toxin-antitoxin system HicA family toxin [Armatimonadetes bacterium]|nr:type II toxin-antitoxin system HicA family toxin [Armatimonadota bacterium]